ncbi:hypothetical protein PR048_009238 [Dryococelus australis]|uniref:GAG-pre-integrase domain-containing protein n=1 Tax=Dryococelus australis TaxID=614101 RepID=A0ABQ9HZA6_9NEOP|nr:hypothetical protein PR048_009238 [Dryococelus australis]
MRFKNTGNLAKHFLALEGQFARLSDAGDDLKEEGRVNFVLLSMPKSYDEVVTALQTLENLSLDLVNRLLGEEKRKKNFKVEVKTEYGFSCFFCSQEGHKIFQRRQYKSSLNATQDRGYGHNRGGRHLTSSNFRSHNPAPSGRPEYFQDARKRVFLSSGNRRDLTRSNEDPTVLFYTEDHKFNDEYFSGHILKEPRKIYVAKNGASIEAVYVGNINCSVFCKGEKHNCIIRNVYYVPDVTKNLLSINRLEEARLSVTFSDNTVFLMKNKTTLTVGYKQNSLYVLETGTSDKIEGNLVSQGNFQLWHCRYGHMNREFLKRVSNLVGRVDFESTSNFLCESCLFRKICQPFSNKPTRANKPLDLINTDVCGPISLETWNGKK